MTPFIFNKKGLSRMEPSAIQHVFIIGSKSIGQYGGYETFVDKLTEYHSNETGIRYHVACKANGDGCMDESKLEDINIIKKDADGETIEFTYHQAHVFKIKVPKIGPAVAVYYDIAALKYSLRYCKEHKIEHPVFYILACRIGPFMKRYKKKMKEIGGAFYLNPDGHEWKRAKWPAPVRKYWKISEKGMVKQADLVICDSVNIEKYILKEYAAFHPKTTFIAYGSDTVPSVLNDDDPKFLEWLKNKGLQKKAYYLVVGRFVPENNYETMIREFMRSQSKKTFALITNVNERFLAKLEANLHFQSDLRIQFVGTVYDSERLKKIRENAYGYFHGHEVGGTNPSLLEALGSTELNLLLDVGFNREVAQDAALYWNKQEGNLAALIDRADQMNENDRCVLGTKAKKRIQAAYSWEFIAGEYKRVFTERI